MRKKDWKYLVQRLLLIFSFLFISTITNANSIRDVSIDALNNIIITFTEIYVDIPQVLPFQGSYRIDLYNVTIAKPLILENINSNIISSVQINAISTGTSILIGFRDKLLITAGLVNYETRGMQIAITISPPTPLVKSTPAVIKSDSSNANSSFWSSVLLPLILFLTILLIFCYYILRYYKTRLSKTNDKRKKFNVLDIIHLNTKLKLWLVDYDEQQYLLSVSPTAVNLIGEHAGSISQIKEELAHNPNYLTAKIRTDNNANPTLNKISPSKFKDELLKRVKQLKPLH